jgi:hypothetical protein
VGNVLKWYMIFAGPYICTHTTVSEEQTFSIFRAEWRQYVRPEFLYPLNKSTLCHNPENQHLSLRFVCMYALRSNPELMMSQVTHPHVLQRELNSTVPLAPSYL